MPLTRDFRDSSKIQPLITCSITEGFKIEIRLMGLKRLMAKENPQNIMYQY